MAHGFDHLHTRLLARAALLFLLFFASAYGAIAVLQSLGTVAAIWPATALALAFFMSSAPKEWPAYLLAAGGANLAAGLAAGASLTVAAGFTACNLGQLLLAAALLRRWRPSPRTGEWLGSVQSLMVFLGVAAIIAPALATTLRSVLHLLVFQAPYWTAWQSRWVADVVGMLTVTPLVLTWCGRASAAAGPRPRSMEIAAIGAGLTATAALIFVTHGGSAAVNQATLLLALPFQIWATLRFGSRGTTAANALVALAGIGTLLTTVAAGDAMLALQTVLAATSLTTLLLAAALNERRAVEARLRDAVEHIGDGFAIFDAEDRLVLSNGTHQQMYAKNRDLLVPGVRFEDILRGSVARGQHPDAIGREEEWVRERLHRHLNPGEPIEQDRGDGKWLLICERRTSDGGIVGTWTDISRLKAQEEALRGNEARLREAEARARAAEGRLIDAIESLNEAFVLFDADDRLILCNGKYREICADAFDDLPPGITFERILRTRVAAGLIAGAVGREEEWIAERLQQHRHPRGAVEVLQANGRWLLMAERRTADGGHVAIATDITRLKHQEEELKNSEEQLRNMLRALEESHARLERQSIELTRLANEAAAQSEAARIANAAKSDFLASVSHELRTPLNSIIGFSEIMNTEMLGPIGTPKYRDYVKDICDSGKHLLSLINDLLDLAKIEAGKLELEEAACDLADIVDASLHLLGERAHKAQVILQTACDPALPTLWADERKVRQILLSNAIKFTPPGGCVKVHAAAGADGGVVLTVSDTGIGIAEDAIERVLEPFTQVENVFSRTHTGTGLGLPLCEELARLHGAKLTLASALGEGTTVTIAFPPERSLTRPAVVRSVA